MCCSISFPYRHKPASRRRLSLAPSPVSLTFSSDFSKIALVKSTAFCDGMEISNPSSPVYLKKSSKINDTNLQGHPAGMQILLIDDNEHL